jgi:hypothetical protein
VDLRVAAGTGRAVCRSAALRRLLGGSDPLLRPSHLPVPAAASTVWWWATLPASPTKPGRAEPLLAAGVLAAAYRAAGRRPRAHRAGVEVPPAGPAREARY